MKGAKSGAKIPNFICKHKKQVHIVEIFLQKQQSTNTPIWICFWGTLLECLVIVLTGEIYCTHILTNDKYIALT